MMNLPKSTEVKRPLPKSQIYKRFDWKPSQRDSFDANVSHLDFVNWISPRTLPAIAEVEEVKEIYVVEVTLKKRDFDTRNIALLAKSIPQRVIYLLRFDDEAMLVVYHIKLFSTPWQHAEGMSLRLDGLNLDIVWENIVREIGNIPIVGTCLRHVEQDYEAQTYVKPDSEAQTDCQHRKAISLKDEINAAVQRTKLERQIAALERQMNATKQPRRKRELFIELQKLKQQ